MTSILFCLNISTKLLPKGLTIESLLLGLMIQEVGGEKTNQNGALSLDPILNLQHDYLLTCKLTKSEQEKSPLTLKRKRGRCRRIGQLFQGNMQQLLCTVWYFKNGCGNYHLLWNRAGTYDFPPNSSPQLGHPGFPLSLMT